MNKAFLISVILVITCIVGCSHPVVNQTRPLVIQKQIIPVTSNPLGAQVHVDGQLIGYTPLSVDLEKNCCHVITLTKPGFQPLSVSILRQKDESKLYGKALRKGLEATLVHEDVRMGLTEVNDTIDEDEASGRAYELFPSTVCVTLEREKILEKQQ